MLQLCLPYFDPRDSILEAVIVPNAYSSRSNTIPLKCSVSYSNW